MTDTPVAIIGAGIGGLIAAIELATRGQAVRVFEASADVGGKARLQHVGGHPINAGPTVLTMPDIFDATLARAGTRLADELRVRPAEILARHAWPDGSRLDLFAEPERSAAAIEDFAGPTETDGYRRFCRDAARAAELMTDPFLRSARPSMRRLLSANGPKAVVDLMRLNPFASLWSALDRYFADPRLRQLFARYATYTGSDPFQASASLMLIAHVEQAGVWQIDGGMHALARALADVARRSGATIECDSTVARIETDRGGVSGLVFDDGRRIATRHVVCNADLGAIAAGGFGPDAQRALHAPTDDAPALSGVTWTCLARVRGFELSHHNVFFSDNYAAEFDAIFRRRTLPHDPTVYVCAEDRSVVTVDDTATGDAPERVFCLANACSVDADGRGPGTAEMSAYRDRVWRRLGGAGLTLEVVDDAVCTTCPAEFATRFPGSRGALYGRAAHGAFAPFARPTARSRVAGLYFAGAGIHPGAGLPMVALSGQHAAAAADARIA